ncbi:MAG: threonylcarbamoyl-AMP synthase [Lachnospiraceae bacterium]|jgi:Sua5/YciO/YrdC/YwlC family protein|nr:threonylcarbamoyl-AMP synthase [Lachnospiraceae bacterium]
MTTGIIKINPDNFKGEELEEACHILKDGGLVAFPTETVYGLGGDALNPLAASKIYSAKGRPSDNPLIVHIACIESLYDIAEVTEDGLKLAKAFWPGPLTLVFKKKETVPPQTTGGLDTVAVRMPCHAVARELIKRSGVYIAAPSANLSGRPSPTQAKHVIEDLDGRIDIIIDGGSPDIGIESTIVDVSGSKAVILRPGYITKDMLKDVLCDVSTDPAIEGILPQKDIVAKAPGMKYRHYAPKGQLLIVEGSPDRVARKINSLVSEKDTEGYKTAVIATDETKDKYKCNIIKSIGTRKSENSIAASLYNILREMDYMEVQYIYSESFGAGILGGAVMNRMLKAAAGHIIQV